ncbi:hypothetical protein FBZ89_10674 [Nitrospirillum amazonense]|uniref:Tail length tape measure protein n=1 Tax=Nitrospirillum amazonense TaxID=28077 RepID=A0A560FGD9_9PROT|nr:hypothetical protein [Nitrospirillum amazonense]TWB20675.1 hypothetical protein FBZ89_10674 [Nitrospirillum amazonense]
MTSGPTISVTADGSEAVRTLKDVADSAQKAGDAHGALGGKLKESADAFGKLGDAAIKMGTAVNQGADPLMTLIDQVPTIVGALSGFSPVGMAVGGALTVIGTEAYAAFAKMRAFDEQVRVTSGHLAVLGQGARAAPEAIRSMADGIVHSLGGTKEQAVGLIDAIASAMPTASAEVQKQAHEISMALASMGKVTDPKATAEIGKAVAQAMTGDIAAIRALNQEYHLLDADQLDALAKDEHDVDRKKAAIVILEALITRTNDYTKAKIAENEAARLPGAGSKYARNAQLGENNAKFQEAHRKTEEAVRNVKLPDSAAIDERDRQVALVANTQEALQKRNAIVDQTGRAMVQSEVDTWKDLIAAQNLQGGALKAAQEHLADAQTQLARETSADLLAQLRSRLAAQQALAGTDRGATLQGEVAGYQALLKNQQLIGREREAVERELAIAEAGLARQTVADHVTGIKDQVAATREGSKEREEALAGELAYVKANYGARSAEARRVEQEITAAQKATLDAEVAHLREDLGANLQSMKVRDDVLAQISEKQRARYGSDSSALRKAQETDLTTVRKYLDDKAKEDIDQSNEDWQRYAKDQEQKRQLQNMSLAEVASAKRAEVKAQNDATVKILEGYKQQALAAAAASKEEARVAKDYDDKIDKIKRAAEQQDREIVHQLERDKQKEYQQTVSGITKSMGTMVQGLVTGTKTVRQAVGDMAKSALSELVGMAEKQASTWIESNLLKQDSDQDTATKAMAQSVETATAQINDAAATGAANAYASASAGPEWWIAPAISAAVQLAISGLTSSLSSAAGGWGRVPADGMLTELHKDEMVLPASIASPLRSALAAQTVPSLAVPAYAAANLNLPGGGAANTNGVSGIGGGANVTFTVQAMDSRDVASFFNRHGDKLVSALRGQKRNFSF